MGCLSDVIKNVEMIASSYFWSRAPGLPSAVSGVLLPLDLFRKKGCSWKTIVMVSRDSQTGLRDLLYFCCILLFSVRLS